MAVMSPVSAPQSTMQQPLPQAIPQNTYQSPVPIVNVYAQQQQPMGWKGFPLQGEQKGRGKLNKISLCWRCGQPGQNKINCPINPYRQSPGIVRGERWQQSFRGPCQGPVNPWGGPNQGY